MTHRLVSFWRVHFSSLAAVGLRRSLSGYHRLPPGNSPRLVGAWLGLEMVLKVLYMCCHGMQALDEIQAGMFDGWTYEEIAEKHSEEYAARKRDKLRYRQAPKHPCTKRFSAVIYKAVQLNYLKSSL